MGEKSTGRRSLPGGKDVAGAEKRSLHVGKDNSYRGLLWGGEGLHNAKYLTGGRERFASKGPVQGENHLRIGERGPQEKETVGRRPQIVSIRKRGKG